MHRSLPFKLAVLAAVSLATVSAHASNRVTFDNEILARVQKVENGLDRVRVYPGRRLVIKRSTPFGTDTSVDGSVDTRFDGKVRKDIVARGSAGKIVAVEPVTKVGEMKAPETAYRLFVSFDPSCTTRECAFVFESPLNQYQNSFYGNYLMQSSTDFKLAAIPVDAEATQVDAIWVGRKPIFWNRMEMKVGEGDQANVFENGASDLVLQVKLNELMNIDYETVKHGGWND